jgi:hypothetical protein
MQGFYNLTTKIKDTLALDAFVNTVTYGDIFEIDLNKQDIFPLSHFIVNTATLNGSTWNFSLSLLCMDLVDESRDDVIDKFLGNNNEQDVLNTQMAVIGRLMELLRRGDLFTELYQLDGQPSLEAFVDRFDNKVAGWAVTFNVLVPNDMTIC